MSAHTLRLHRVLRASPEKVYRAFLDADALIKWMPPYGFTAKVYHLDAKVGGTFRMSFDPNLPGEMQMTVTLKPVLCGTDLSIEQAGVPAAIPAEMCYLGWQESLAQLALVVEPDIKE